MPPGVETERSTRTNDEGNIETKIPNLLAEANASGIMDDEAIAHKGRVEWVSP